MRHIVLHTIALLMASVIVLLIANKSLFTHTHILNDGTVIVHAHPYNKANSKDSAIPHSHTSIELHFLQVLSDLFVIAMGITSILLVLGFAKRLIYCFESIGSVAFRSYPGRAPPIEQNLVQTAA